MKFNPSKLAIARKRRMLNKKTFAESISVEPHTVTRWERSQREPSPENLAAIEEALSFPKEFFLGEDIDEPTSEATSFRSQTAMTAARREAALAAGAIGFLVSDWVEARFDLPEPSLPDLHLYDPETAARSLRQEWSLGERPVSNMIHLLESRGIRVFSLVENATTVNAYSLWRREKPYVFLNTIKSAESSRFDAAHELAHLVLHQDGKVTGRLAEDQANQFASAFLMPQGDILSQLTRINSLNQLLAAKVRWKVSLAALNYRCHKLGLTSDWKYRDMCIEIARRGYNKSEPHPVPREKSTVWEKVLRNLWSEGSTHLDIANDLHLPGTEVTDLLFGILSPPSSDPNRSFPPLALVPN